jgi:hypothetical protein
MLYSTLLYKMSELDRVTSVANFYEWVWRTSYSDRCKVLYNWDPRPMITSNPAVVPHIVLQMMNTGGDYKSSFVAWFNKYSGDISDYMHINMNGVEAKELYLNIAL